MDFFVDFWEISIRITVLRPTLHAPNLNKFDLAKIRTKVGIGKKKHRKPMFSPNPGFPQQNRGFIANPSFFRGLEGQGKKIYSSICLYSNPMFPLVFDVFFLVCLGKPKGWLCFRWRRHPVAWLEPKDRDDDDEPKPKKTQETKRANRNRPPNAADLFNDTIWQQISSQWIA